VQKRLTAVIVISLFIAQILIPGIAGAGITEQTNLIKQLFKIPAQAKLVRENEGGTTYVNWSLGVGEDDPWGYAEFDGKTGAFLSYSEEYDAPKLAKTMPQADVQKFLESIIDKMFPDKKSKVKLVDGPDKENLDGDIVYDFYFERFEGEIPVFDNYLNFTVNASTGRITYFGQSWFNGELPAQTGVISKPDAENVLKNTVPLQVEWVKVPSGHGDLRFHLWPVYQMTGGFGIDAKTGSLYKLGYVSNPLPYKFDAGITPKTYTSASPDKTISEEEATAIARSKAGVPSQYNVGEAFSDWSWGEQGRTGNFVFYADDSEEEMHVTVDRVTGQVKGIFNFSFGAREGTPYDYSAGKPVAENYAKSLNPEEFSETRLIRITDLNPDYEGVEYPEYFYLRYIYGIPYRNWMSLQLDNKGGLISYSFNWERNLNIPKLTGILDDTRMRDALAQDIGLELGYWIDSDYETETESARLLYMPKTGYDFYDAVTGQQVQFGNIPAGVTGHWSEDSFRSLASLGIVNPANPVKPDKPISRADFIKMLVLGTYLPPKTVTKATFSDVGLSSPYLGYIEQAYARGIVKGTGGRFLPDKPITRQEAAVILVKALKSENRIGSVEIKETAFKDKNQIASWAAPDVKLAAQLGYIKGANGYFKPASNITWAEAAAMISNYIENQGEEELEG
jgi:hypothetical protein